MLIGNRNIGRNHPPFIIAEMSGNHNHSLERAIAIVDAAAEAGADAVKLQTYTADSMTLPIESGEFMISNPKSPWFGKSLYQLYSEACTPYDWHGPIFERAKAKNIFCFSSPFDNDAVDLLQAMQVPCYKVASYECVDLPLIAKIAATGKPLILSTGMATQAEVDEAVTCFRVNGGTELVLMKCTSTYPASESDSNLRAIPLMRKAFRSQVGLSDHTQGIGVAVAAVSFGACIIEKHFTLSRADGGVDAEFSLEPAEFKSLVTEVRRAWEALGSSQIGYTDSEQWSRTRRRSLYISKDLKAGDTITEKCLRRVRPGHGLPPKYYNVVLNKTVICDVSAGTPVSWEIFGKSHPN
jgi:pseudaminic acid synthase